MFRHNRLSQIEDYAPFIGAEAVERIRQKAKRLQGLHVAHVNSTYYGGGVATVLTEMKMQIHEDVVYKNAVRNHLEGHDVVIIHDPQPLAMITHYEKRGTWIWRCHIDLSNANKELWSYLSPFIEKYDAVIFSIEEYRQNLQTPQFFFLPAIDPFSITNKELTDDEISERLGHYGIWSLPWRKRQHGSFS